MKEIIFKSSDIKEGLNYSFRIERDNNLEKVLTSRSDVSNFEIDEGCATVMLNSDISEGAEMYLFVIERQIKIGQWTIKENEADEII